MLLGQQKKQDVNFGDTNVSCKEIVGISPLMAIEIKTKYVSYSKKRVVSGFNRMV